MYTYIHIIYIIYYLIKKYLLVIYSIQNIVKIITFPLLKIQITLDLIRLIKVLINGFQISTKCNVLR